MGAEKPTRRAFPWCPTAALQPLTRGLAIACRLRLAVKYQGNAEHGIVTLKEYEA
jgi:hypothetical protein